MRDIPIPRDAQAWIDASDIFPARSSLELAWSRIRRNLPAMVALTWIVIVAVLALAAPFAAGSPNEGDITARLAAPSLSSGNFLGTDEQGRDMLTRLWWGSRISLISGIVPVSVGLVIGTTIGVVAAYRGGALETALMRIMDVSYAFPPIILAIALAVALGRGLQSMLIALSIVSIPPISRVAHSACRQVVVQEYVIAARAAGCSPAQVMLRNVVPNALPQVIVYASAWIGGSILSAATLSFLGLGPQPPAADWGSMLTGLSSAIYVAPFVVVLPGLCIFVTVLSFNMLSDGLADALEVER